MRPLNEHEMRDINGGEIIIEPHTLGGLHCMGAVMKRFFNGVLEDFS